VAGLMAIRLAMKTNSCLLEVALDSPAGLDEKEKLLQTTFVQEIKAACAANKAAQGGAAASAPLEGSSAAMAILSQIGLEAAPTTPAAAATSAATASAAAAIAAAATLTPAASAAAAAPPDSPSATTPPVDVDAVFAPASEEDAATEAATETDVEDGDALFAPTAEATHTEAVAQDSSAPQAAAETEADAEACSAPVTRLALTQLHDSLMRELGVSDEALGASLLSAGTGAGAAAWPAGAPPPPSGSVRVLQWNLLARGLADDGFLVSDVLGGADTTGGQADAVAEAAADTSAAAAEALSALRGRLATPRARANHAVVLDPARRWARVRETVAAYRPDILAFQELDWMAEAIPSLAALGYECGTPDAPPHRAYLPPHAALASSSADEAPRAEDLLEALASSGRAFAPKHPSVSRRQALALGSADAADDGVALFWRRDTWAAASLEHFVLRQGTRLASFVKVNLRRSADGAPLSLLCAHLPSGASDADEARRLAFLDAPTLALLPRREADPQQVRHLPPNYSLFILTPSHR